MAKKKKIDIEIETPKARIVQKVSFRTWFSDKVSKKIVKGYQASEITVFFKKQGLTDKEEMKSFDSKLNRFLGK